MVIESFLLITAVAIVIVLAVAFAFGFLVEECVGRLILIICVIGTVVLVGIWIYLSIALSNAPDILSKAQVLGFDGGVLVYNEDGTHSAYKKATSEIVVVEDVQYVHNNFLTPAVTVVTVAERTEPFILNGVSPLRKGGSYCLLIGDNTYTMKQTCSKMVPVPNN